MRSFEDARAREDLEVLAGRRPKAAQQSAVRVADLLPLLHLPGKLKSAPAAGAAPTKAEHDALVSDVLEVANRLKEVATLLQGRLLP